MVPRSHVDPVIFRPVSCYFLLVPEEIRLGVFPPVPHRGSGARNPSVGQPPERLGLRRNLRGRLDLGQAPETTHFDGRIAYCRRFSADLPPASVPSGGAAVSATDRSTRDVPRRRRLDRLCFR